MAPDLENPARPLSVDNHHGRYLLGGPLQRVRERLLVELLFKARRLLYHSSLGREY